MSATSFKSKHKGLWWVDEGGFFYKSKKNYKTGWIYMICVKKNCPGSCKIKPYVLNPGRGECVNIQGHCCVQDSSVAVEELRRTILLRAQNENTPKSIIFQEEINR